MWISDRNSKVADSTLPRRPEWLDESLCQLLPDDADELLVRFSTYWLELRGEAVAPAYRDIDPVAMPWALSSIFIMERPPEGPFVYRLCGEQMRSRLGPNLRGKSAFDVFEKGYAEWTEARWRKAADEMLASYVDTTHETAGGRVVRAQRILFPALSDNGAADFLVGVTAFSAPVLRPGWGPDNEVMRSVRWTRLADLPGPRGS